MNKSYVLALFLFSYSSFANAAPDNSIEPVSAKSKWSQRVIDSNIAISEWFDSVAEGIDLFLAGKRLTNKKNKTQVRLEGAVSSMEGKPVETDLSLGVALRLPNVEEYWQVKFSSYDDLQERRQSKNMFIRQNRRPEDYGATLGLFRKLGNIRTAFQPRILFKNPVGISHSLSFENVSDMKTYSVNPRLELYAEAEKGAGTAWNLNININLSSIHSLTLINSGDYASQTFLHTVNNGFSIGQIIDDYTAISYGTIFTSVNQPEYQLSSYSVYVTLNKVIYKNVLDFQVTPHFDFNKDDDFRPRAGLSTVLGMSF